MKLRLNLILLGCMMSLSMVFAQTSAPDNWFNLDLQKDGVPGVSTERAYQELLKGKKGQQIIVAVLDSGVDYDHEDLSSVMWVNEDEIPGNGIDDDKNGYVDDMHGWNFLGNKKGEDIHHDNLEVTRLYVKYKQMFDGKDASDISKKDKASFEKYGEYKEVVEEKRAKLEEDAGTFVAIANAMNTLQKEIGKDDVTEEDINNFESDDPLMTYAKQVALGIIAEGQPFSRAVKELNEYADYLTNQYEYHYNPDFEPRGLVNDNYADPYDRDYGNNNYEGPDARHGTHVAGIIAASRGNGTGMEGVADNVRIMSVRTVPDGDERDKDVAAAIVYAVDNGASVINMSFGKGASPRKELVDEAIRYAEEHDVLIVHAAGNDSKEVAYGNNYPTDRMEKRGGFLGLFGSKYAENWVEVGALNWKVGDELVAPFSNYSKEYVDLFAPGMEIYSTVPDSEYEDLQGTSMAAPVVAGVAAMLRSYFPDLTAEQVKEILLDSTVKQKVKVTAPGSEEMVPFSSLSVTGGIVNAYKAVEMAQKTKGKKKGVERLPGGGVSDDMIKQNKKAKAVVRP
ncbi:MAG: S8 family serine peptidase [Chitinophagales bacterium]|nr:S8 family serine peptidase [Chitinophagales bacterium]